MQAARSRRTGRPNAPVQIVRLRPVAGIAPATYLTALYGSAVVALLFITLVLPGLRFSGTVVEFSSSPPGATVFVDGRFTGVTPVTAPVTAGERAVTLTKKHFVPEELQLEVGGRILLSWPFPRRDVQHVELVLADPETLLHDALLDLAHNPRIPGIVTAAAADLTVQGSSAEHGERLLRNALLLVEDEAGLADLLAAHARLAGGAPLSAAGLQHLVHDAAHLAGESPGLPLWLAALLPEAAREALLSSPWYAAAVQHYRQLDAPRSPAGRSGDAVADTVTAAGMVFRRIPAGTFIMGDSRRLTTMQGWSSK